MIELPDRRTYTMKAFDTGRKPGERLFRCKMGHVHYKDGGVFHDVDNRLLVRGATGWDMEKASYHCLLPRYADGLFRFFDRYEGKRHDISARPDALHVEGELSSSLHSVLYREAFGPDIDLEAEILAHGLRKTVVIHTWHGGDLTFDFELPEAHDVHLDDQGWARTSLLDITGRLAFLGKGSSMSLLKPAWMWDAAGRRLPVTLQLIPQGNRTILRKTVPAAFLQQAVFPVRTDHPTNYTIGTGDGYAGASASSWNSCHDSGGSAGYASDSSTNNWCWTYYSVTYKIYRSFLPVDTSGVSGSVSAATLYLYVTEHVDPGGSNFFRLVETTQPDTSQVLYTYYPNCGAVDNPTSGGELDDGDVVAPSDWSSLTLNATGLTYIDDSGWSLLGLRESQDAVDSWTDGAHKLVWNSSDNASNKPYVDITASSTKGPPSQAVIIS